MLSWGFEQLKGTMMSESAIGWILKIQLHFTNFFTLWLGLFNSFFLSSPRSPTTYCASTLKGRTPVVGCLIELTGVRASGGISARGINRKNPVSQPGRSWDDGT